MSITDSQSDRIRDSEFLKTEVIALLDWTDGHYGINNDRIYRVWDSSSNKHVYKTVPENHNTILFYPNVLFYQKSGTGWREIFFNFHLYEVPDRYGNGVFSLIHTSVSLVFLLVIEQISR